MKTMRLEKAEDGFAILTLDAEGSMNVVNDAFIADMEAATKQIVADESIKGVILTSAKKTFMAGADLKQLVNGFGTLTPQEAYAFSKRATDMHRAIEQSGKPWVAAINGLALGGVSSWRWRATGASWRMMPRRRSVCPKSMSVCCPDRAAPCGWALSQA